MKKITMYYVFLATIITIQFVISVIGKSVAVQQSVTLVDQQKELASLEKRESELINTIAAQTSLAASTETTGLEAITRPIALTPSSLVAAR